MLQPRRFAVFALLAAALLALAGIADKSFRTKEPLDFGVYWTTARLIGSNPYDPERLLELQRSSGMDQRSLPRFLRNPPWTLPLIAPLVLVPLHPGRTLWFLASFALLALAATLLFLEYGSRRRTLVFPLAASFVPALVVLQHGQIAFLMLLGAALFLRGSARGRWFGAGLGLSLTLVKPHLVLVLLLVVCFWAVERTARLRVLGGLLLPPALASLVTIAWNPSAPAQYLAMLRSTSLEDGTLHTLGGALFRWTAAPWTLWLPALLGISWAVWYWLGARRQWEWRERLPPLLLVSFLASPYGYVYDGVVLLAPLIAALSGTHAPGRFLAAYGLVNLAALVLMVDPNASLGYFVWIAVGWAVVYLLSFRLTSAPATQAG